MTQHRSVGGQRMLALADLDRAAAEARSRHIAGAGQDTVYAQKLVEARAYIEAHRGNPTVPVPPYVAVDVAIDGGSALARALAIVAAATAFHAGPGPAIEQARRQGKRALQAATTADGVQQALAAAIAALGAI